MGNESCDIDFVLTWVDSQDPEWQEEMSYYRRLEEGHSWSAWTSDDRRFRDWGLLKYWFRCTEENAPWVRKIHFVTCGHLPSWLNTEHPKLHIVRHSDYIPEKYLPTFNSHCIEMHMHLIEGLSERFVYFNDDTFLLAKARITDFFKYGLPCDYVGLTASGIGRVRTAYSVYNAAVVNDWFKKNEVIKKHPIKWFNLLYGPRVLFETMLTMPYASFKGFQNDHLPNPFLKSTFYELWNLEGRELDAACTTKFRGREGVSTWLFRDWQRAKGSFAPCAANRGKYFGPTYYKRDPEGRALDEALREKRYKLVCINDECESEDQFERMDRLTNLAFEATFPAKSSFEV